MDISNLAPEVNLATSLLLGLDLMVERTSVPAAPALASCLTSPATAARSPPLHPALGESPGLGMVCRGDGEVCWPVRAAGLQPGHTLALLTTQSSVWCLAAEWEHLGPFPGQIIGWLGRIQFAKFLSATYSLLGCIWGCSSPISAQVPWSGPWCAPQRGNLALTPAATHDHAGAPAETQLVAPAYAREKAGDNQSSSLPLECAGSCSQHPSTSGPASFFSWDRSSLPQ